MNFDKAVCSTPILIKYDIYTLVKRSNEKYKTVDSPLRNVLWKTTPVKAGVILPLGSEYRYPDPTKCRENNNKKFNGYSYKEGIFMFIKNECSHLLSMDNDGKNRFDIHKYTSMLRKLFKMVNNNCVVNVHSVHYPKHLSTYFYMYCSHRGCKSFKVIAEK